MNETNVVNILAAQLSKYSEVISAAVILKQCIPQQRGEEYCQMSHFAL